MELSGMEYSSPLLRVASPLDRKELCKEGRK